MNAIPSLKGRHTKEGHSVGKPIGPNRFTAIQPSNSGLSTEGTTEMREITSFWRQSVKHFKRSRRLRLGEEFHRSLAGRSSNLFSSGQYFRTEARLLPLISLPS